MPVVIFLVMRPIFRAGNVHGIKFPAKQGECFLTAWDQWWSLAHAFHPVWAWDLLGLDQGQIAIACVVLLINLPFSSWPLVWIQREEKVGA